MHIEIKSLRILSPSPTTFILDVEQSTDEFAQSDHVTYVGSAEHCFSTPNLVNSKLAHSTTYSTTSGITHGDITAYAMFDMNDVLIGTNADFSNQDPVFKDYIIAPSIENVDDKLPNPINGIVHNKNGFIGVIPGIKRSPSNRVLQSTPSRKYDSLTGYLEYSSNKEAITLYDKHTKPQTVKQVLRVVDEYDIDESSASKLDQVFIIQTFHAFDTDGISQQPNQNITAGWGRLVNNFDHGVLSAASLITPKQTLNSEYSTVKSMVNNNPYDYMRDYTKDGEFNMYTSGNLLVFNYIESKSLKASNKQPVSPTQISTAYSAHIGLTSAEFGSAIPKEVAVVEDNITESIVYQNYLPEVVNLIDDGFGGTSGSTVGAKRAIHKANIFDIDLANSGVTSDSKFNTVMSNVPAAVAAAYARASADTISNLPTVVHSTLHKHISDRLQALVSELIPAHTHLYRVVTSDVGSAGIEPTVPTSKHPFSVVNGMLLVNYDVDDTELPYSIIFNDADTAETFELIISIINGEITLQLKPYAGFNDSINTIILQGTRKYSGAYTLYTVNGDMAFRKVSYDFVPNHPFTVTDGVLNAIHTVGKDTYEDIIFADVSTDQLMIMSLSFVDDEIVITITPRVNDDTLTVVTTLPITGTGTLPGDYVLYVNNGHVELTYINPNNL